METETYSIPVYHYSRWHYYNTGYNKWYYSYAEYTGSNYKPGTGNWEYMSSYEPLSKNGTADGHQRYENYWWNETVSYEQDSYEVTYYRYRDRNKIPHHQRQRSGCKAARFAPGANLLGG